MQNEALLRQRQVRIGGSAYLVMSDAGAGFDGLDDATSQATTTTSTEPHIESVSSDPGSTIVRLQPAGGGEKGTRPARGGGGDREPARRR